MNANGQMGVASDSKGNTPSFSDAILVDSPRAPCYAVSTRSARVLTLDRERDGGAMEKLTARQEKILKLVVSEYVCTAQPVGSEFLHNRYTLGVSSATIRNEMYALEQAGYLQHPHTSAGRVPSDRGYRYYVESLMDESALPVEHQRTILHQFHQVELAFDQWARLAASVLASCAQTVAMATLPTAPVTHLKRLEMVPVQEALVLLVIVLYEGILKQQLLALESALAEEDLSRSAHKLTEVFRGRSAGEISKMEAELSPVEEQAREVTSRLMHQIDAQTLHDLYVDGMLYMLRKPEFSRVEKLREVMEALENRALASVFSRILAGQGVHIIIGGENEYPALRDCSVIIARYGGDGEPRGVVGLLGPTRMEYGRSVSSVKYVTEVMSTLVQELKGA